MMVTEWPWECNLLKNCGDALLRSPSFLLSGMEDFQVQ